MNSSLSNANSSLSQAQVYTDLAGLDKLRHSAKNNDTGALRELAGQFESIFISIALKSMRAANEAFAKDSYFDSEESRFYRDMFDNQMSLTLSQGKGIGLADSLVKQLSAYLPENQQLIDADTPEIDISL